MSTDVSKASLPAQVLAQERCDRGPVYTVRSVEERDAGAIPDAQFIVEAPHPGVFVRDPFVDADAISVSPLYHEGPRRDP